MRKRVLAVASFGGHWQQLREMRAAFEQHEVTYVSTRPGMDAEFALTRFDTIPDCNRNQPLRVVAALAKAVLITIRLRPHVVISTGAMPGLLLLFCGWLTGAKTIWIDSFANPERMTMSGAYAKRFATHCLVQWEDLAKAEGVGYRGRVL